MRDVCWLCGGKLIWQSDFNYDEIHGEGEGIVAFLLCSGCGADVRYSLKDAMKCEKPLAHKPEAFSGYRCKTCEAERGEQ